MGGTTLKYGGLKLIFLLFAVFALLPVLYTYLTALNGFESPGVLFSYQSFVLLFKSLIISFFVASLSTFFGIIFGFFLYKTQIKYALFFKVGFLLPLLISPYILAVSWSDTVFLLRGTGEPVSPVVLTVLVLTFIYTPLSVLIVGNAFSNIDTSLEESGLLMTSPYKVVFKIVLPLVKPAILASFILVFIFSVSEYSVPSYYGVKVITTEIFTRFSAFYNHSDAIMQSSVLLVVSVLLLVAEGKYLSDAPFLSVGSKGDVRKRYYFDKIKRVALTFITFWFLLTVVIPLIILIFQSLKNGMPDLWKAVELLRNTVITSLEVSFAGALLIFVTGFAAAYYVVYAKGGKRIKKLFNVTMLFLFALPSTVLGISFIVFYNRPVFDLIYSGMAIVVIGYWAKFSFISFKILENSMKQIPVSFDEAAIIEGVPAYKRIFNILTPLILPAVFAAFIFAFIFSFGELGTTITVHPPGTGLLPVKVFTVMANASQSLTSSMVLLEFSVSLILVVVLYLFYVILSEKYGNIRNKP